MDKLSYFVCPLDSDNLVLHCLDVLEGLMVGHAVADNEALSVFDVQIAHGRELLCPRRVQNFQDTGSVIHLDFLPVEILNGWIVFLHEMSGHKLDGEGGLADAAGAQDNHFELSHDVTKIFVQPESLITDHRTESLSLIMQVQNRFVQE